MKQKTVILFESFDGQTFDTQAECAKYERDNSWRRVVGLTIEEVEAALAYEDIEVADAIEALASQIIKIRLSKGFAKRVRSGGKTDNDPELPPPVGRANEPPVMTAAEAEELRA